MIPGAFVRTTTYRGKAVSQSLKKKYPFIIEIANPTQSIVSLKGIKMPSSRSRLAWLEPLDTDEPTLSPPHWKDFVVPGSMGAYSSVALAGVASAALAISLGLGRPAIFAMVAVAHCVVAGLVVGGSAMTARAWPIRKAKSSSETKHLLSVPQ